MLQAQQAMHAAAGLVHARFRLPQQGYAALGQMGKGSTAVAAAAPPGGRIPAAALLCSPGVGWVGETAEWSPPG